MQLSLKNKFLARLFPIITISILLISYFVYDHISKGNETHTSEQTSSQISMLLQSIEKNTEKSLEQYKFIANNASIKDYISSSGQTKSLFKQKEVITLLQDIYRSNSGFKEVYLFDQNGQINFTHSDQKMYDHRTDNAWLNSLIQSSSKNPLVSIQETSNGHRITYTIQINDSNSNVMGYLVGTESFSFIQGWMRLSENANINGSLLLFGGKIVERSGEFNTEALLHHYSNLTRDSLNTSKIIDLDTGDENNRLYIKKGYLDIYAGVIVNNNAYLAMKSDLLNTIGLITLAVLLFIVIVVYGTFTSLITKRLDLIKDASKKIAIGNHGHHLPENQNDEVGNLFRTINQMSQDIQTGQEKIHDLAYFDELTGLRNKASFNLELQRMIALCESNDNTEISFLSIDLDDFKSINDLHGHHTGDRFLKIIAKRLEDIGEALKEEKENQHQVFISRLAGDEFAILIYGKNIRNFASNLSSRVIKNISEQMSFSNTEIYPTCSIGISTYPYQAKNEIELIKYSDIAMYEAKRFGKNQAMPFEFDMIERVVKKEEICNDIKIALEHDSFDLYLQPKFNVKSRCFNKFESLIRWIHPEKGFISPGVFIPVAEDSNLIVDIGDWVLKQTCKNIRTMENKGWKNFCVSFNVSPQQLLDGDFSRNMERNISIFNINPNHLEIEVTETSCAENIDFVTKELDVIRRMGVSVALDDFGTGYSSLSYIKELPLDVIKLDRAFVSKALSSEVDMTIIKSVMNIAEVLQIKTVAEGVETVEESKLMQEVGVDYIQGFYFYKPLPMADIMAEDFSKRIQEVNEEEDAIAKRNLSVA